MSGSLLAIETSCLWTGAAVIDSSGIQSSGQAESLSQHNELLPGLIADVMARANKQYSDISWIGVSIGPGSFTALRIGLLAAKGIAFACGIDIIPVMSLDVINASLVDASLSEDSMPESSYQDCLRLPVMDAYKGELFTAVYSGCERRGEPVIVDPLQLKQLTGDQPVMVFGPAIAKYREPIQESLGANFILPDKPFVIPSPAALTRLAWAGRNQARSPQDMEPFYLRKPDARLPGNKKNASGRS